MIIRKARPEETPALTKIVEEAHRHWGYPQDWVSHAQTDSSDLVTNVFVAEDSDGLQGFYRLSGEHPRPAELWVAPPYFGTGVGKELFLHAMENRRRD